MNEDQKRNVDEAFRKLSHSMFRTWSELHLLQGLHIGAQKHAKPVMVFDRYFTELWNAIMFALMTSFGTLIDTTPRTSSLPNIVSMLRRYGALQGSARTAQKQLDQYLAGKKGALEKLRQWRHKVVAHRDPALSEDFFVTNKMDLGEIEETLRELNRLFNHLSMAVCSIYNDTEAGSMDLVAQGEGLLAALADQLEVDEHRLRS